MRWCTTKDTCSSDVARHISCALVSVSAFIHSSVFRLKLGPNLIQIVLKIICPFLPQIKYNGLFSSVPSNKLTQYPFQGLAPGDVWNSNHVFKWC